MGEISIDPKFNIHETYKKVRILNPYRNSGVPSGSNDADAANYLAAVGIINDATVYYAGTPQEITGAAIYTAMNNFVGALKSEGVYAKLKAVYPLIGGNAGNHKWNLINPQDTNAAHRMLWYGSGIHSKTGFKGDASTAYGDTNFNSLTHGIINNESFGFYSRTDIAGDFIDMGHRGGDNSFIYSSFNGIFYNQNQTNSYPSLISSSDSLGFYQSSRELSDSYKVQKGTAVFSQTIPSTGQSANNFYLANASVYRDRYTPREYAYCFTGEGLTDTQMTAHYNAVQNLQTDLKRAV